MADKKISELNAYTPPLAADVLPIVDVVGDETKKITWANIRAEMSKFAIEPPTDDTYIGAHTNSLEVGESITQWDLLYLKSDGKWWKTNATVIGTSGLVCLAIAAETKSSGVIDVILPGTVCRNDAWTWTAGSPLYVSEATAGLMTHSQPDGTDEIIRVVGYALSDDCIFFFPSNDHISHT